MAENVQYEMNTPTLLVGLGGLGSSIVQSVYSKLPIEYRKFVRAHVMDTDVKELKDARYTELRNNHCFTQTSSSQTIEQCLNALKASSDVDSWFPQIGRSALGHKQMSLGAAQVRSISRLALFDTMMSNRVSSLQSNIQNMLEKQPDALKDSMRVILVNSVAGGTGSGSFLQVAMYIREFLEKTCNAKNVLMRAFLVMPEVFIRNGDYAAMDLQGNVQANGYAALKEIDAVVRLRAGVFERADKIDVAPFAPVRLEYEPGSVGATPIKSGPPPFDYVTLFDFNDVDGQNLKSKDNYINQVEDAIFLQLFSPLEGRGGITSQEDNLILTQIQNDDRARYVGAGTSNLVYPFKDIVDYAALRWATDGISGAWLEIDKLILDEIKQVNRAREEGNFLEMPDPHDRYCDLLRDKSEGKNVAPFYRGVFNDAHLLDDRGQRAADKSAEWLLALAAKLKHQTENAIREKEGCLAIVDQAALEDKANTVSQVQQSEEGLKQFQREVDLRVQPIGMSLAKEAMWKPYDDKVDAVVSDATQMNTWVLGRTEPMHPAALRYFLGEARRSLKGTLGKINYELGRASKRVDLYENAFDDPSTDDIESAVDAAQSKVSKRFAKFLGGIKDFAEEYLEKSGRQRRDIERKALLTVEKEAYELLLRYIEDMLETWRTWFLQLNSMREHAASEIDHLARRHDNSPDRTVMFVHASKAIKEAMWESQRAALANKAFPPQISRELYMAVYSERGKQWRDGIPATRDRAWTERLFSESVVEWCTQEIMRSPEFDMDVSSAIKAELVLQRSLGLVAAARSAEDAFAEYANALEVLATPWVNVGSAGQTFKFCCVHPEAAKHWSKETLNSKLPQHRLHAGFSRYKISRVTLRYGLCATHFPAVANALGSYRRAYDERIAKGRLPIPQSITPHLDYHWDSPAFFPEIDDTLQANSIRNLYRSVLLTLADIAAGERTAVFPQHSDTRDLWHWSPVHGVAEPLKGIGDKTEPSNAYGLLSVLASNFGLVATILAAANARETAERSNPTSLPLITQAGALIDQLSDVSAQAPSQEEGDRRQRRLLVGLFDEIHDIFYRTHGAPRAAQAAASTTFEGIKTWSKVLAGDPASPYAKLVFRIMADALARSRT